VAKLEKKIIEQLTAYVIFSWSFN